MDITRYSHDRRKHYDAVRALQGRLVTDDELNEADVITKEDRRLTRVDLIGPSGSPDQGFQVSSPTVINGKLDFKIAPGTMYLGGLRLVLEAEETFAAQRDWLQQRDADRSVPNVANRVDLAYLEAWQQPVTSVEDSELLEAALGGVDTGARMRHMRRVRLLTNVGSGDCQTAWKKWLADVGQANGLSSDAELASPARLTVDFSGQAGNPDLCSPTVTGGYLGAENQAIRVEVVDPVKHLLAWGFDNGAPLYRVLVSNKKITLLTPPRDEPHWPVASMSVEIIAWSSYLANAEKVAEMRGPLPSAAATPPVSYFTTVATSYDPDSGEIFVNDLPPTGFNLGWQGRYGFAVDQNLEQQPDQYVFMRVWYRGSDTTVLPLGYTPGQALGLGQTGLTVTVDGATQRAGDFWTIAARPSTPEDIVPWQLSKNGGGRPPDGVHVYYSPLATIAWDPQGNAKVHDCRATFPPLTQNRTCCTYTVGNDDNGGGDFATLQEAVNQLLAQAGGGEICVLPGVNVGNTVILNGKKIRIHGCGSRSILRAATSQAVLQLIDCEDVDVMDLRVESPEGPAILISQATGDPDLTNRTNLRLRFERLQIEVRDDSAVRGRQLGDCLLSEIDVTLDPLTHHLGMGAAGTWPAFFLQGDDLLVEKNRIAAVDTDQFFRPLGGIQIAGGSQRVVVRRNHVSGGNGIGIVLGSTGWSDRTDDNSRIGYGTNGFDDGDCCPIFNDNPQPGPRVPDGPPPHRFPEASVVSVRVVDNDVSAMGLSGIGVEAFFQSATKDVLSRLTPQITAERLTIENNRITSCAHLDVKHRPSDERSDGGVALAWVDGLVLRDNTIEKCGAARTDPVTGVYVMLGRHLILERNRLVDNGPTKMPAQPGEIRGGMYLNAGWPPFFSIGHPPAKADLAQIGEEAARIHDNVVLSPCGRALTLAVEGPASVQDNRFTTTFYASTAAQLPQGLEASQLADAATVLISQGSVSPERFVVPRPGGASGAESVGAAAVGGGFTPSLAGNVLFHDNTLLLNLGAGEVPLASLAIGSGDDVSVEDNHLQCFAGRGMLTDAWIYSSATVRLVGNRFEELVGRTPFSAFSFGAANITVNNQATHCIVHAGQKRVPQPLFRQLNQILTDDECGDAQRQGDVLSGADGADETKHKYVITVEPSAADASKILDILHVLGLALETNDPRIVGRLAMPLEATPTEKDRIVRLLQAAGAAVNVREVTGFDTPSPIVTPPATVEPLKNYELSPDPVSVPANAARVSAILGQEGFPASPGVGGHQVFQLKTTPGNKDRIVARLQNAGASVTVRELATVSSEEAITTQNAQKYQLVVTPATAQPTALLVILHDEGLARETSDARLLPNLQLLLEAPPGTKDRIVQELRAAGATVKVTG